MAIVSYYYHAIKYPVLADDCKLQLMTKDE